MPHRRDNNVFSTCLTPDGVTELLAILTSTENPLSDLLTEVLNAVMLLERQHHLLTETHERT